MFHFDLMNCSLVSTLSVCVHKSLELSNSFITLNNVLTQPLLITKQMAAHNPFFFFTIQPLQLRSLVVKGTTV